MESALALIVLPGPGVQAPDGLQSAAPHHSGTHAPPEPGYLDNYQPKFFSPEEFDAVSTFCEILIPTDEDPGAKEARCALFIDYVLNAAAEFAPERQKEWRSALNTLRKIGFMQAGRQRREELVREMAAPEIEPNTHHEAYGAYRLIKAENAFAFYSSRAGLIETLDYKGNSFNQSFPPCNHPEHHRV